MSPPIIPPSEPRVLADRYRISFVRQDTMRIPRKSDLISLQEVYKTDTRIAEALGGIPEYLIAYWRRKKGVPTHSAPKFTEAQINDLWERYGDDFRCGRELNISKAAFYSWRRKYGITEKPAVLKLEQLELRLSPIPAEAPVAAPVGVPSARTSVEKIRARCRDQWPEAVQPADWRIAAGADPAAPVPVSPGPIFRRPDAPPGVDTEISTSAQEPMWCLPERGSLGWQLIENRIVAPGQLILGPREMVGGCGGVAALALEPEAERRPLRVVRVEVTRRLGPAIDVEDIVLGVVGHGWRLDDPPSIVEYSGGPIERLTVDRKTKLCSLTVRIGAQAALCPFDDMIRRHYSRLLLGHYPQTHPDRAAIYDGEHFLEGGGTHLHPQLGVDDGSGRIRVLPLSATGPGGVIVGPEALPFEIEAAASLLEGRVLSREGGSTVLVCPATVETYRLAQRRGWAQTILDAGGSFLDVGLARRLGFQGLVEVAVGRGTGEQWVYCTGFTHAPESVSPTRVVYASARTALAQSGLLP